MIKSWRSRLAKSAANFRDDDGVAAVEFAMLSPAFIAMILVATLVAVIFMAKSELDYATQRVARLVMTRQVTTASALQTQLCNYISGIFDCTALMVNLTQYSGNGNSLSPGNSAAINTTTPVLTYNASGKVSNAWNTQFGNAGSIMVLQVMYQYPMISGMLFNLATQANGSDLIVSTAVFVNE